VVDIVLETAVDDGVVRGDEGMLIAAVEVHTVAVEEEAKLHEQDVHVDGEHEREKQQGERSHELVHRFICNDGEGAGIGEHMVVLVMLPETEVSVAHTVVEKLKEIAEDP